MVLLFVGGRVCGEGLGGDSLSYCWVLEVVSGLLLEVGCR